MIEIGERNDQPDVVDRDEVAQGADVPEVVDSRYERAVVGVIERGSERIQDFAYEKTAAALRTALEGLAA